MPRAERKPYLFQSVDRALRLLELVANEPRPRTVRQLAELSGYERTMTYRLLSTLEHRKFVERDPVTETYSLGIAATSLSNPAAHNAALIRYSRPELEQLMDDLGQTISLGISQHGAGVVIDQIDPPNPIRLANNVNVPLPLHCTSNGKLILARMSDTELEVVSAHASREARASHDYLGRTAATRAGQSTRGRVRRGRRRARRGRNGSVGRADE